MTSETYQDYSFDRLRGQKRPLRPKLLKLTDVSMPHRNRKKTKTKVKQYCFRFVKRRDCFEILITTSQEVENRGNRQTTSRI